MIDLPPLEPCDTAARWPRVAAGLDEHGCDALVVTDLVNIRYLTGFTGSNAIAVVSADGIGFITDGRYRNQAAEEFTAAGLAVGDDVTIEVASHLDDVLAAVVGSHSRIGVEADNVTWATVRGWTDSVFATEVVATTDVIARHRAVKDPGEVSRLHRASAIADAALASVRHLLHEAVTEREFRRALEDAMADLGSEAPSFETIVAGGANAAKPHSRPTDRIIGSSADGGGAADLVVIDFGATVEGYHSDMTRTYAVGDLDERRREILDVVRRAQVAGTEAVRAGRSCRDVDAACRDLITAEGYGDEFIHGTGHGIGLEIHERPGLSASSADLLASGMCVTVEPGVYIGDVGGVRVEDSVVVTAAGSWHLTQAPYE